MKKLILFIMILLLFLCSSSCSKENQDYEKAVLFDSQHLNNSFDNLLSGGKITYFDGDLYVVYYKEEFFNCGVYKINSKGTTMLIDNKNSFYLSDLGINLFHYNDQLYSINYSAKQQIKRFDFNSKEFVNSELNISPESNVLFISDEFLVWKSSYNQIKYQYKNQKAKTINDVYLYYVKDNIIYYCNYDNSLYMLNCNESNSKSTFLGYLKEHVYGESMIICGRFCYYNCTASSDSNTQPGFYCYSIDTKNNKFLSNNGMCSMISYDNKIYATDGENIYIHDGITFSVFSDISTQELYIVDNKWIYTNNNNGQIYRISLKNSTIVEQIIIDT